MRRECFGGESREMNSFARVDLRNKVLLSWHNIIPCCLAFGELRAFQKIVGRCHDNLAWGQSNESHHAYELPFSATNPGYMRELLPLEPWGTSCSIDYNIFS